METRLLSVSQTLSPTAPSTQQSLQTSRPQSFQGECDKDLERWKTRLIYWNCQKPPFPGCITFRKKKKKLIFGRLKELTPR